MKFWVTIPFQQADVEAEFVRQLVGRALGEFCCGSWSRRLDDKIQYIQTF